MKINLAKFHCAELRIWAHLKLSLGLVERIVSSSHGHRKENVPYMAVYGNIYKVEGIPHVVLAHLRQVENQEYHVEFRYLAEKWTKPPRTVKSVSKLTTALEEEPQVVTFSCNTQFIYDKKGRWKPRVDMPIALTKGQEDELFTHIEAITLGKQEKGQTQYRIEIGRTEDGNLRHRVYLYLEAPLTENMPKQFLERSADISKLLLQEEKG